MKVRLALTQSIRPLFLVALIIAIVGAAGACSSTDASTAQVGLAQGCSINSDCNQPLVCAFQRCHNGCTATVDCPSGERCMASDRPFHVCQLPIETKCSYNSQCPDGQVCGVDGQCRDQCASNRDCVAPQLCTGGTCAEKEDLQPNGQLPHVEDTTDAGSSGLPCQYNSQCPTGLLCRSNLCVAECLATIDCPEGRTCLAGRCIASAGADGGHGGGSEGGTTLPSACSNGVKDGAETDVDCGGGPCAPCPTGSGCAASGDCASGTCTAHACQAPTCGDGTKNGNETGVDCGGDTCGPCDVSKSCRAGADCATGLCIGGLCHALDCTDGRLDNAETDVDCGGGTCPACDNQKECLLGGDCRSGLCSGNVCQGTGCGDGLKNGTETDVDCGGASCGKCAQGQSCGLAADCATAVCTSNRCQAPQCGDGVRNGTETDIDCGGGTCSKCADAKHCVYQTDCTSGACASGVCKPTYALQVQLAGGGSGTVTSLPAGIDCGATCTAAYAAGTGVQLSASPSLNATFTGWSGGGCNGAGTCIATMSAAQTITATFSASANGAYNWGKSFATASDDVAIGVDFAPSGNAIVAGTYQGTVDFGGGSLNTSGIEGYVAVYSPSGSYIWARHFNSVNNGIFVTSVRADGNGDVLVTGYANGATALGDVTATTCTGNSGYQQGWVAKYVGATGAFQWAHCMGQVGGTAYARAAVPTPDGHVVVVGQFAGSATDFGGKTAGSMNGSADIFFATYAGEGGTLLTVAPISSPGTETPYAAVIAADGNVIVGGAFTGTTTFGGPSVVALGSSEDAFVAKFTPAGSYIWARTFGDVDTDRVYSVATDANGNVAYTGVFSDQIDPGGVLLNSAGGGDIVVGKYAGANGAFQWAKRFGGASADEGNSVAALANGDVVFTGQAGSSLDLGGGLLPAPGAGDIVVGKLSSSTGTYVWSNGYGSSGIDSGNGVAVNASGAVLFGGSLKGAIDFGGGVTPYGGSADAFLVKLTP